MSNNAPLTREEIIKDIQDNLEKLPPAVLADYSIRLASYLSTLSEQLALATKTYYTKWVEIRSYARITTDGRAEAEAKATEEYYKKNLMQLQFDATVEMINAIKKKLGYDSDELRSTPR